MSRARSKPHRPYPVTQERVGAMCVCGCRSGFGCCVFANEGHQRSRETNFAARRIRLTTVTRTHRPSRRKLTRTHRPSRRKLTRTHRPSRRKLRRGTMSRARSKPHRPYPVTQERVRAMCAWRSVSTQSSPPASVRLPAGGSSAGGCFRAWLRRTRRPGYIRGLPRG